MMRAVFDMNILRDVRGARVWVCMQARTLLQNTVRRGADRPVAVPMQNCYQCVICSSVLIPPIVYYLQ